MIPLHVSIDLGTANVLVALRRRGIIVNEPSVVAYDKNAGKVLAVGAGALDMLGKTPGHIVAMRPLRDGVIVNLSVTETMLRYFLRRAARFRRIMLTICVPSCVTPVERRAVREAAYAAGAAKVWIIEEPLAAAYGAGLDMRSLSGRMVIDIGGGTTDIAVISGESVIVSDSVKAAGSHIDEAIIRMLRREYGLIVSDRTAENLKIHLGCAVKQSFAREMEVSGSDAVDGLPKTKLVNSAVLTDAIAEPLEAIAQAAASVLARTAPELSADLCENGAVLTGGGALLEGIGEFLQNRLNIPAVPAEEPLLCAVKGLNMINTGKIDPEPR